ncbi:band 7 protein AGAP004871-like isoform X4 [Drosophila sulfurigaster albostrigata]|uniref:band 7 protein AGAP004871-like isoform X4 n=1 Tax=Drosophila sulfurigaster albostrigata TaxID=89887 RepID=UPI002D21D30A|nr:band 7 protein AGAP004871-like isoform X4 [Drosophila sulfurigaster albostrigata]
MSASAKKNSNRPNENRQYIKTSEDQPKTSFEIIGTALSWFMVIITFPISIFICYFRVDEYDRAIIFRLGRVRKNARGPGLVWHLPCIDSYRLVDLRTRVEVIPSQDAITKDSVKTTLRNMVGSMTLHELLISRQILSEKITRSVDHTTEKWGVKIERVELKDINLPDSLQRSLASEAEALRDARAKIISAEGELKASQALKEASNVMAENEITLQLRHLQTLSSVAQEHNLTIVYPFPMEMMSAFTNSGGDVPKKDTDNFSDISSRDGSILFSSLVSSIFRRTPDEITPATSLINNNNVEHPEVNAEKKIVPNIIEYKLDGNAKSTQTDFPK